MKLIPIALLILLTACAAPDLAPAATATIAGTPLPTATATIAPSPTPDALATSARAMMDAAATNVLAAGMQATAMVEVALINERTAGIEATKEAQEGSNAIILQNAENIGNALELQMIYYASERARWNAIEAEADSDFYVRIGVIVLATVCAVLFGGALLIRAIASFAAWWREYQDDDEEADDEPELPAYPGGIDIREFVPSIPIDTLVLVARAFVAGVPFTYGAMTPKYISKGKMYTLQHMLVKRGGARWFDPARHENGCEVLPKGEQFFKDVAEMPGFSENVVQ